MAQGLTDRIPSVLDPWLPWLRGWTELAEATFGPWMARLASAVGPVLERREPDPSGEPTGWSGLTNRGPYDRLLMSEWLLAEELPDEFLRRATTGEHLFVELDRSRPHRSPWTVLLCDAGPEQLGSPRLVQLALLVVLASRRAGPERLAVGALQGGELLEPPLDGSTGRRLMDARTRTRPTADDARRWARILADEGERPELWVVGGSDARTLPLGRSNRVLVEEDWRTGDLVVGLFREDGVVARITLPSPPSGATAVLADPFLARRPVRPVHDLGTDAISATYASGRWLLVRTRTTADEALVALATPTRVRNKTKKVGWCARSHERLLAAGRVHRRLRSLWSTDHDDLVSDDLGRIRRMPRPPRFSVAPGPLQPLIGHLHAVLVADSDGRTWELDFETQRAVELPDRVGPPTFLPEGGGVEWRDESGAGHGWRRGVLRSIDRPVLPPPVPWAAELRFAGKCGEALVGVLGQDLIRLGPDGVAVNHPLDPEPIVVGCADPAGFCYAVVTRKDVRWIDPTSGQVLATWRLP